MVALGGKRCSHCTREKPVEQFHRSAKASDGLCSWCKACKRILGAELRQTQHYREWIAGYLARPDVKRRRRESNERRADEKKARDRAYRQTPRARLLHGRKVARHELRRCQTERGRRRIAARIAAYEAELARLDLAMMGERKRGRKPGAGVVHPRAGADAGR